MMMMMIQIVLINVHVFASVIVMCSRCHIEYGGRIGCWYLIIVDCCVDIIIMILCGREEEGQ
jgi:hypothetical protein